jgi:hypothetical protein
MPGGERRRRDRRLCLTGLGGGRDESYDRGEEDEPAMVLAIEWISGRQANGVLIGGLELRPG